MNNKELLNFYYMGWELASDDKDFPKWFEFGWEKTACLLGYNDFQFGLIKEKEDIVKEIRNILK